MLVGVLSHVVFVVIDWCLVYISNVYLGVVSKKLKKVQPESSAVFGAGVLLGTSTSENQHFLPSLVFQNSSLSVCPWIAGMV